MTIDLRLRQGASISSCDRRQLRRGRFRTMICHPFPSMRAAIDLPLPHRPWPCESCHGRLPDSGHHYAIGDNSSPLRHTTAFDDKNIPSRAAHRRRCIISSDDAAEEGRRKCRQGATFRRLRMREIVCSYRRFRECQHSSHSDWPAC